MSTMKRLIVIVLLAVLAWQGFAKYQSSRASKAPKGLADVEQLPASPDRKPSAPSQRFACDGRTRCSQMTSCEEATFFLKNCPGTKMDGNNDGVPCEQQWCK
jgi:predicted negative regulator of RcsB-dependent stress response